MFDYKSNPGKHIYPDCSDFNGDTFDSTFDKVVATHFFYWWREYMYANFIYQPTYPIEKYLWDSINWWRYELDSIQKTGIDALLLCYNAYKTDEWSSNKGLVLLDLFLESNSRDLKFGMFFNTSEIVNNKIDLSLEENLPLFYYPIQDFFSRINPKYWFRWDGRIVVVLYSSNHAKGFHNNLFEYAREQFGNDFNGSELFIVGDKGWERDGIITIDATNEWGCGLYGVKQTDVINVAPGYKDIRPKIRDREDGQYYLHNWTVAKAYNPLFIIIETWNELFEGTQIENTIELGNHYSILTKKEINNYKFNNKLIMNCYQKLLKRNPSKSEFIDYLYLLNSEKAKPFDIIKGFINSGEFKEVYNFGLL